MGIAPMFSVLRLRKTSGSRRSVNGGPEASRSFPALGRLGRRRPAPFTSHHPPVFSCPVSAAAHGRQVGLGQRHPLLKRLLDRLPGKLREDGVDLFLDLLRHLSTWSLVETLRGLPERYLD